MTSPEAWSTFLGGYVFGEFISDVNEKDNGLEFIQSEKQKQKYFESLSVRHNVGFFFEHLRICDLGGHPVIPYLPDNRNPINGYIACHHRFGCRMDQISSTMILPYARKFIDKFLVKKVECLPDFRQWLDATSYNTNKKLQLSTEWDTPKALSAWKHYVSKSFLKWESYNTKGKIKNARAINSYTDTMKAIMGPVFKCIDKSTYENLSRWVIKGMDIKDLPDRIIGLFGNERVMATDYSSFEAHHRGVYHEIFMYWVQNQLRDILPILGDDFMHLLRGLTDGINVSVFPWFTSVVDQRLMSGAMWTSSSNCILNIILTSYLVYASKYPHYNNVEGIDLLLEKVDEEMIALFEGDDGLVVAEEVDPILIAELGLKLKFEFHDTASHASFCGVVCDHVDRDIIKDPIKVLRDFFLFECKHMSSKKTKTQKNVFSLLRAKALSFKYSFGNCPIIGVLADKICTMTRSVNVHEEHWSTISYLLQNTSKIALKDSWKKPADIKTRSRLLMEEVFSVSMREQEDIERRIVEWDFKSPLALAFGHRFDDVDFSLAPTLINHDGIVNHHVIEHYMDKFEPVFNGELDPIRRDHREWLANRHEWRATNYF